MPDRLTGRGPGPSRSALIVLALMSLALLATSQAPAQLEGTVEGAITIGPGEVIEREVRVHLEPAGGADATNGTIRPTFVASSGLDTTYPTDVGLGFVTAREANGEPVPIDGTFPIDRCVQGCDLTYVVRFTGGPTVLPGSVARYRIDAVITYGSSFGQRDSALMRIDVDDPAGGPVMAIWAVLAGVLAIALGIAIGPRVDAGLGPRRRRWPAWILTAAPLLVVGSQVVAGAVSLPVAGVSLPLLLLYVLEPWSIGLLAVLTFGMIRGLRRWDADGGWTLGLGAVAQLGLGGLWLAWWATLGPTIQPTLSIVVAAALGTLGGIVIGQAWRAGPGARHDRWWAAVAVIAHGIVVAGFAFLAVNALYDPFGAGLSGLLLLIPAALVALAFRRWFRGRSAWLLLFDLLIAGIGLLGTWLWMTASYGFSNDVVAIDDVAVGIALVAALVAFVTACHDMARRDGPPPGGAPAREMSPVTPPGPPVDPPTRADGDPATT